ncbi:hypothetical protein D9M71_535390 [compost metagenome]
MPQQIEVVDQVGQQHPRAGLAPPGCFKIAVGLAQLPERRNRGQPTQCAAVDKLVGADDQRIVATMMSDQYRNATRLRGSHQLPGFIQVHAHRFFQQYRHAGREAIEGRADVQRVRVGDYHGVRLRLLQHLTMIGETGYAPLRRKTGRLRSRIGHGAQRRFSQGLQMLVVLLAHVASTDQGDAKWRIQDTVLL